MIIINCLENYRLGYCNTRITIILGGHIYIHSYQFYPVIVLNVSEYHTVTGNFSNYSIIIIYKHYKY